MHLVRRRNLLVWFLIIAIFYLILTKIDLIVHYDLYRHGLQFSEDWAIPYWWCLTASFWALAALSVSSYWLESRTKNKYLMILIILTILIPYHFGVEDILWFLWHGQFPADDVVWTWYWLNQYFPPWTTTKHLIYSAIGIASLAACWTLFLTRKWIQFTFSYLREQHPNK